MDFIIYYEHFNREIENIILIKNILQKRGYSVVISHFSMYGYAKSVLKYNPKVVVVPWLRYDDNIWRYTRFRKQPKAIINLQWEQIYSKFDFESKVVNIQGMSKNAFHICWGDNTKERLLNDGIREDHLKITGAIQLDFGSSSFETYYRSRKSIAKEFNLDSNKKWILYISSFAMTTFKENEIEEYKTKWNISIDEFVKIANESRKKTFEWIEQLLEKDRNIIFIYRVHPSERKNLELKNLCDRYDSFKVISDYSVKQWIKICDSINMWYSTSIAEVYAMHKNCIIVRPIPLPERYEVEIMRNAEFITTKTEFLRINMDNLSSMEFPVSKKILERYYYQDSNNPAYIQIANYLENILEDPKKTCRFKFTLKEKKFFGKLHRYDILVSLIVEFYFKTRIKLSKIIPFKQEIFNNIEKFVDQSDEDIKKIEKIDGVLKKILNGE